MDKCITALGTDFGKHQFLNGYCINCDENEPDIKPTDLLLSREEVFALYETLKSDSFGHHDNAIMTRNILIKFRKFLDDSND